MYNLGEDDANAKLYRRRAYDPEDMKAACAPGYSIMSYKFESGDLTQLALLRMSCSRVTRVQATVSSSAK